VQWVPGEKLIEKIWTTVTEKGIAGLLSPWQIRREGRARIDVRREEALAAVRTQVDIEDILAGRKLYNPETRKLLPAPTDAEPPLLTVEGDNGRREPRLFAPTPPMNAPALARHAEQSLIAREMQRSLNLQRIAHYAEEAAEGTPDEKVSDAPIDPDWFENWRRRAAEVSGEVLQRLWAKILAGETTQPGSFAVHTLDLLSRLSRQDAETIGRLGPFLLYGSMVFRSADRLLEKAGISFETLLLLEELGILSSVHGLGSVQRKFIANGTSSRYAISLSSRAVLFETDHDVAISIYPVTRVGQELLKLGHFGPPQEYVEAVAGTLKNQNCKVWIGDWIAGTAPGKGTVQNAVEFTPQDTPKAAVGK
jgi:hypothetical protein